MSDKSWKLLTKLINACGYDITQIEDEFDFDELCDDIKNRLACKTQECEELKKQLMQKSEVDMFFNTPIEGWSNDPCGICPHKAENEELKERLERTEEDLKYQCVDCMNVKSDRYRKAITEIKEIAEFSYRPYNVCGEYNETCSVLTSILNIIKELEVLNEE